MSTPQNSSLGIPGAKASLNLSPSVQKQNLGSATGNPRNKCALKPGHSLMDWIRLGNSGCDLSGTKGAIVPVSTTELGKHCLQDDAWMAIRGKVYNVTRYMDFHPGGPEELMRGVGKDATKLFDQVHAWVNYEQLLKKCLIGPLRNVVKIDADFLKPTNGDFRPPAKVSVVPKTTAIPAQIIPRFDWIQKRSDLCLYFYTKQFCNPGLIIKLNSSQNIAVSVFIENNCHLYDFKLHNEINWPPTGVKVSTESGKIELNFAKTELDLWPAYGTHNYSMTQPVDDYRYKFGIVENQKINHNSFALQLSGKNDVIFVSPVGYHVSISCSIEGSKVSRSYTPVSKCHSSIENGSSQDLFFLLKTYPDGLLAKHINGLQIDSGLEVSHPKGSLQLTKFLGYRRIALLAAGSGITPFLNLIVHLLARNSNRINNLVLLYFNKTEEDIWCKKQLEDMTRCDDRFHLKHVLSQPSNEWTGERGHISTELMSTLIDQESTKSSTFICVCGPSNFNSLAETILRSLDFSETAMHFFNG